MFAVAFRQHVVPRGLAHIEAGQNARPSRKTERICSRSAAGGGAEDALELGEFGRGGVGDGPKAEVALIPMPQVVALPAKGLRAVAARGRQYEQIDDVLAALVDERRDRLASDQVEAAAYQRKTLGGEVNSRRRYVAASGKPRLYRVLVRGGDIGQMRGQKRAQMAVDDRAGDRVLLPVSEHQKGPAGADRHGEQQRGGIGEPSWCPQSYWCADPRFPPQRKTDP